MRVGHARIDFEIGIPFRIRPDMAADIPDSIMGSTHESLDIEIIGGVDDLYDALGISETHRLRASFFFREMVDAEKLIITEQNSIHSHYPISKTGSPRTGKAFTAETQSTLSSSETK
jgi:hypothetical protein